jgi:hypothetical protein
MTPTRGQSRSFAAGLLHVLAASLTGGTGGSRAAEDHNPRAHVEVRAARAGVVGRALDAPVEPVTLPAWREGAHPTRGAAA